MNKEQQELLDEAYENYKKTLSQFGINLYNSKGYLTPESPIMFHLHSQEEFIERVITNPDFAKQWGVTIYTVVEDENIRIGVNYNGETIENYE